MMRDVSFVALIVIAVFVLIFAGLVIYVAWLSYRLERFKRECRCRDAGPEVPRDSDGRRLQERE